MDEELAGALTSLDPSDASYASRFVEIVLGAARRRGVSDLHLQPTPRGLELRWRIDGVLAPLGTYPLGAAANVVSRLKALAELLSYRTDVPQEGRIRTGDPAAEVRVSTFPTLHGERAVIRLFTNRLQYRDLGQLSLPVDILDGLRSLLVETAGAILVAGPAGSGKTTTLYACLEEVARASGRGRSIMTLEDPIEVAIEGISQSQVNDAAGFGMSVALRSALRQDPEVIMIGEIRDRATAEVALQASLTGQLVLSSFHSGSAAEALGRLGDMGIEPYVLASGVLAVLFQRLVRTLCECARAAADERELLGLKVTRARVAIGCTKCAGTGYVGRTVLAELLQLGAHRLAEAILDRADVETLDERARQGGMVDRWSRAVTAVEAGLTSPAEVRRVLGFGKNYQI